MPPRSEVDAAVAEAAAGVAFDADLEAKFRVLQQCEALLGERVPSEQLHAVTDEASLRDYYRAALVPPGPAAAPVPSPPPLPARRTPPSPTPPAFHLPVTAAAPQISEDELPANLTLDGRDEALLQRVLASPSAR